MRRMWTEEEDNLVRSMWTAGEKEIVIAAVLKRSLKSIDGRVFTLKLPPRRKLICAEWGQEMTDKLIAMWRVGEPLAVIAEALGVTRKQASLKVLRIRHKEPWLVPTRNRRKDWVISPIVCKIQDGVSDEFKVAVTSLIGPSRLSTISGPRHVAMALCKRMTNESLPSLAFAFNRKDHTTVMYGVRRAEHCCKGKIDELEMKLRRKLFKEAAE